MRRIRVTRKFLQIAAKQWKRMYYCAFTEGWSFRQARAFFIRQHGYAPPRSLPFMPTREIDWWREVRNVELEFLTSKTTTTHHRGTP